MIYMLQKLARQGMWKLLRLEKRERIVVVVVVA